MRPVAKRHVGGLSTTAQCHAITHFVSKTVFRFDRDTAHDKYRAADAHRLILKDGDRWFVFRLDHVTGFIKRSNPAGRAIDSGFDRFLPQI